MKLILVALLLLTGCALTVNRTETTKVEYDPIYKERAEKICKQYAKDQYDRKDWIKNIPPEGFYENCMGLWGISEDSKNR